MKIFTHLQTDYNFSTVPVLLLFGLLLVSCSDDLSEVVHTSEEMELLEGVDPVVASDADFKVFDATYFRSNPWALDNYGLDDIKMAYPPSLWGKSTSELEGTTTMPDKEKLTKLVQNAAEKGIENISVNIEHWPLEGSDTEVENSIDRFIRVKNWIKEAAPGMKVGFYSVPPIRSFSKSTKPQTSPIYEEWVQQNERLQRLANNVDTFYPSLYTFNDDREKWVKEAKAQIEMARALNGDNPVYIFLWPQYHPYYEEFANRFIERDYWKLQLETARKYADGIVIWTPRTLRFNNDAPWWVVTRRFMVYLGKVDWAK